MKKNPNGPGASAPWLAARSLIEPKRTYSIHVKNYQKFIENHTFTNTSE